MQHDLLVKLNACRDAQQWSEKYPDLQTAWSACERGDWMLWLCGRLAGPPESASRKKLVLAACACARLALPHTLAGETRPIKTIETAEAWANGAEGVTLDMVRTTADAAYAAAKAADATTYAAYLAAYAAAKAAYADAARPTTLKQCADIMRAAYPTIPADERSRAWAKRK